MNWRYVITDTGAIKRLMASSKMGKQRRKLSHIYARELAGTVPQGTTQKSLESWLSNAKRGDTYYQRQKMIHFYYDLKGKKQ